MGIRFVLLVNKQGQTRVAQYYQYKVRSRFLFLSLSLSVQSCNTGTHRELLALFLSERRVEPNNNLLAFCTHDKPSVCKHFNG